MLYLEANALLPNYNDILILKKHKWQDDKLLELAIRDSLNNARLLQDYAILHEQAHNIDKLEQELMDLFILLCLWADDESSLLQKRLEAFLRDAQTNKK